MNLLLNVPPNPVFIKTRWYTNNMKLDISQALAPCVLHAVHSPITVVNELHHPFPQAWQKRLWGEVRDDHTVSVCATGHNNVHAAIAYKEKNGKFPDWCVGATREMAQRAFDFLAAAEASA